MSVLILTPDMPDTPIEDQRVGPFRVMLATKKAPCPYCEVRLEEGEQIIGEFGVRWGHTACVTAAYDEKRLILSKANAERRLPELEARSTGSTARPKKPAPAWSDTWLGRPESVCQHFQPQAIQVVHLPEELRLSKGVIEEMSAEQQARAEEVIWEKYLETWMAAYKREQRSLPYCPVHQWSPDLSMHLQIKVAHLGGVKFGAKRALWWYCPGR